MLRTPITVGVLKYGQAAGASIGASNGDTFTTGNAFDALIKSLNSQGGVAGRMIKPVAYEVNPSSTNYETAGATACTRFSQDNHVAVAVTVSQYYSESYEKCLSNAGIPAIESDYATPDTTDQAKYPLLFNPSGLNIDRRVSAMLTTSAKTGWLSKKDTLGVLVEDCTSNKRAYARTIVPVARQLGISQFSQTFSCFSGFGDLGAVTTQLSSAMLRMRSQGATKLLVVSAFEATWLLLMAQQNNSQGWYPGYVLSSASGIGAVASNFSKRQLVNMRGAGWLPSVDITVAPALTSNQRRCLTLLRGGGVSPKAGGSDYNSAYAACDTFFFLEALLQRSRGQSGAQSLRSAAESLGSTYSSPLTIDGRTAFRSSQHDGPTTIRPFGYVEACSCFRYL